MEWRRILNTAGLITTLFIDFIVDFLALAPIALGRAAAFFFDALKLTKILSRPSPARVVRFIGRAYKVMSSLLRAIASLVLAYGFQLALFVGIYSALDLADLVGVEKLLPLHRLVVSFSLGALIYALVGASFRVPGPKWVTRLFGFEVAKKLRGGLGGAYKNSKWTNTVGLDSKQIAALNDEFEIATAEALRQAGFRARLNGASLVGHAGPGDGGVDVIVSGAAKIVVSCKRYQSPVGVAEVRDIFAVSKSEQYPAHEAMLVTTVGFTAPALEFARKNGVHLTTLDRLIERKFKAS